MLGKEAGQGRSRAGEQRMEGKDFAHGRVGEGRAGSWTQQTSLVLEQGRLQCAPPLQWAQTTVRSFFLKKGANIRPLSAYFLERRRFLTIKYQAYCIRKMTWEQQKCAEIYLCLWMKFCPRGSRGPYSALKREAPSRRAGRITPERIPENQVGFPSDCLAVQSSVLFFRLRDE